MSYSEISSSPLACQSSGSLTGVYHPSRTNRLKIKNSWWYSSAHWRLVRAMCLPQNMDGPRYAHIVGLGGEYGVGTRPLLLGSE